MLGLYKREANWEFSDQLRTTKQDYNMKFAVVTIIALCSVLTSAAPQSRRVLGVEERSSGKFDFDNKHPDYDLHVLAKRDEVEDGRISKRQAQRPAPIRMRFDNKHKDYDLHVLAKRDEDVPDVDFEDVVHVSKRSAQNRPRFEDKHVDYDQHVLAKRETANLPGPQTRRSSHRRNLPEFPGRSKSHRRHAINADAVVTSGSPDEGNQQQVRGRRMIQSSEELKDYDHIFESRNPIVESRSLQRQ